MIFSNGNPKGQVVTTIIEDGERKVSLGGHGHNNNFSITHIVGSK